MSDTVKKSSSKKSTIKKSTEKVAPVSDSTNPKQVESPKKEGDYSFLNLDQNQIKAMAFEIAKQKNTWDAFVWLVAEAELKVTPAFAPNELPFSPNFPKKIRINPAKIEDIPPKENVKKLAEQLAAKKPTLQNLHWYLAERTYIYQNAKKL
jgi:hypothetical protein